MCPAAKAVYPSSVLMNIVPAKVAGVEKIIMTHPLFPEETGRSCASTLVAAREAGVDEIYKVGGAQAIAAHGFRYESLSRRWTRSWAPETSMWLWRKRPFTAIVSIDSIAGPSEILVLADETAQSPFCGGGSAVPGGA